MLKIDTTSVPIQEVCFIALEAICDAFERRMESL